MKLTDREDETPLLNIERSPLLLLSLALLTAAALFFTWNLLSDKNPWGFIMVIPALILSFQLLWLFLHPFAKIFADRIEISQSFVQRSDKYFTDIKKITVRPGQKCYITYNDDEIEKLKLRGIKPADFDVLTRELEKQVAVSMSSRP